MERMNKVLRRFAKSPSFQEQYEQLKLEVMENHDVQKFIQAHHLSDSMIEKNLMKLYEFASQSVHCNHCENLEQCQNMIAGYEPVPMVVRDSIEIHYRPCHTKKLYDERKKSERLIKSMYVPKDILHASIADFSLTTPGRMLAFEYAERFISEYKLGHAMKGLYLYGNFGVGKSYLLGAIANQLAEKDISSLIVYVPEFLREMKQSINDHSLGDKLEVVKKAQILMLDDIGAEAMTSWTRDEVLGVILQYRMNEQLPTFFTSNFDWKELQHHLTYSQRGEVEEVKAARMMERIKTLSTPIQIDGPNRRNH